MDDLDRRVIDELQENFPLEADPYEIMAENIGKTSVASTAVTFRSIPENAALRKDLPCILNLDAGRQFRSDAVIGPKMKFMPLADTGMKTK